MGRNTAIRPGRAGFSIVELMVVICIIVLLITIAVPSYTKASLRSKESVLKSNLFTIRTQLQHYTCDRQKAPAKLQDLVTAGYLQEIPVDPITGSNQTWKAVMEEDSQAAGQMEPGIIDVLSGSDKVSLDGNRYSEWK
jgi:general secretion pathway protein G